MLRGLVPWSYPFRNLLVRWPATLFSALGIAMTVAVLCGVFALRDGFDVFLTTTGKEDVLVYLRPGATSEGESGLSLTTVAKIKKERPEIALGPSGAPLAAGETYLALFLEKADGMGSVNVPIRGVEEMSFAIHGSDLEIVRGSMFAPGSDQIIVGQPISKRLRDCDIGDTLIVNMTPFRVVGIFEHPGAYRSEIWGDVDRIAQALDRPVRQRVVARMKPGTDVAAVKAELESDKQYASKVQTEAAYFADQTDVLGDVLKYLGIMLTSILGIGSVLGAANTMMASIGARTREVGVLRSLGFGRRGILVAFLVEAGLIGLLGGLMGSVLVLPLNGLQTGTMNWNTFTETAFAFRVDAKLISLAIGIAVMLGILGGLLPAWRAARMRPVDALRRG